MFYYRGNKLVELPRVSWQTFQVDRENHYFWCPEAITNLDDNLLANITNLRSDLPEFVLYFKNLLLSDIFILKCECDLILTSITYQQIKEIRESYMSPRVYRFTEKEEGPISVLEARYKFGSKSKKSGVGKSSIFYEENNEINFIKNAKIDSYIYRQSSNTPIELDISPIINYPDAYIVKPKKNIEMGVYMILVSGKSSNETLGKGATFFSIGSKDSLDNFKENDIKLACTKLNPLLYNKSMKIGPCK